MFKVIIEEPGLKAKPKEYPEYGVTFPAQPPIYHSPPNESHLQEWVDSQISPKLREIARTMVENLRYVPFEEFLSALKETVEDFKARLKENEPYVLLIEPPCGGFKDGCSDSWIATLALEHCGLPEPIDIINVSDLLIFVECNPNVKKILILDDAAYSGTQKSDVLRSIVGIDKNKQLKQHQLYLGIPFLTKNANLRFRHLYYTEVWQIVTILKHQILSTMDEILSNEQISYLNIVDSNNSIDNRHVLTYFDHKVGDVISAYQRIHTGDPLLSGAAIYDFMKFFDYTYNPDYAKNNLDATLLEDPEEYNKVVEDMIPNFRSRGFGYNTPIIISPYKLCNDIQRLDLKKNIENGKVGERTSYSISDPKINDIVSNTLPQKNCDINNYKHTVLTEDQQRIFDSAVSSGEYLTTTYKSQVRYELFQKQKLLWNSVEVGNYEEFKKLAIDDNIFQYININEYLYGLTLLHVLIYRDFDASNMEDQNEFKKIGENKAKIAQYLLNQGADLDAPDKRLGIYEGQTPWEMAARFDQLPFYYFPCMRRSLVYAGEHVLPVFKKHRGIAESPPMLTQFRNVCTKNMAPLATIAATTLAVAVVKYVNS